MLKPECKYIYIKNSHKSQQSCGIKVIHTSLRLPLWSTVPGGSSSPTSVTVPIVSSVWSVPLKTVSPVISSIASVPFPENMYKIGHYSNTFPSKHCNCFIPYCIFHSYLPLESFGASSFWSAVSTKVVPVSPVTKRSISAVVSGVHGPVFSSVISLHFPVKGSGFTSIRHSIVSAIII